MTTFTGRTLRLVPAALLTLTLCAALWIPLPAEAAVNVTRIRHWSYPSYTRVVIELSSKADYSHRLLKEDLFIKKPRRLYVDVSGASLAGEIERAIPINDGLLKMVRTGQYDRNTARIVLDIESIEDYKVFPLSDPYRIVIDVKGRGYKSGGVKEPPPVKEKDGPAGVAPAPTAPTPGKPFRIRTVVIDAGHGGKDPGAIGKRGLKEKDVTLKIAKMVQKELAKKIKGKVILTRNKDVYIALDERTVIANAREADIFVSIHVNASRNRKASGVETYFLDFSNDKEAIRVAARENATTTDAMGDLDFILRDLQRTASRHESSRLATLVQESLSSGLKKKYRNIKSNGVKGAPFYVLVGTEMPSILVEVSFISNPTEEKRLRSDKYLREIVKGIVAGIERYANGSGAV